MFNLQLFQVIVKFCLYLSVTKRLAYYMQFQFKSFRKNIWRLRPFTFTANRFQPLWKNQQNTVFECSLYIFLLIYMILYCMTWLHLIYTKIMPRDLFPPRAEAIYPWPWEDLVYVSYSIISNSTCIWLIPQPEHWQRKFW